VGDSVVGSIDPCFWCNWNTFSKAKNKL